MLHLALSLMNRLSHMESDVFKLWMALFPIDLFSDCLESTTAVVVPCGGPKKSSTVTTSLQ